MSIKNQTIENRLQPIGMTVLTILLMNVKSLVSFITYDIHFGDLLKVVFPCNQIDLIRLINDPEHPLTLEELHVVQQSLIKVDNEHNEVFVNFTPTIPHCRYVNVYFRAK